MIQNSDTFAKKSSTYPQNQTVGYTLLLIIWLVGIVGLAWIPSQNEFSLILLFGGSAFVSYYLLWRSSGDQISRLLVLCVIGARLAVVPTFPNLSDDIYRFLWDGRLLHLGIHPMSATPTDLLTTLPSWSESLYPLLNSPDYFSIYPAVPQGIFWFSTLIFSNSLLPEAILMKSIHFAAELGCLQLLWLLIKDYGLPLRSWLLYALNPLIIIEVIANVHHEGIMLCFVLGGIYLLRRERAVLAGFFMALSIATKILPLLLCPLLFFYLKGRSRWLFTGSTVIATGILFLPLLLGVEGNLSDSLSLYMNKFEFNGSIYYLLRWWGNQIYGFNLIHIIGPALKLVAALGILWIAIKWSEMDHRESTLPLGLLLTYLVYSWLNITLHPWYIVLLIGLSVLTTFRFVFVWSGLIMLTYINYSVQPYDEVIWIVGLEYLVVFTMFHIEWARRGISLVSPIKKGPQKSS
ncbi:MAG: glycosyltransferase 87 family protein [Bacteroidota bacterium]